MEQNLLLSFASNFTSYLLRERHIANKINRVILFGKLGEEINLFIDSTALLSVFEKRLTSYYRSEEAEKYFSQGVNSRFILKVGKLDKLKSLRAGLISNGIKLFDRYEEVPNQASKLTLFMLKSKKNRKDSIRVWRRLYGYKQKVGKKRYASEGLISELGGKKLAPAAFVVPAGNENKLGKFLRRNKVRYTSFDIWSNSLL